MCVVLQLLIVCVCVCDQTQRDLLLTRLPDLVGMKKSKQTEEIKSVWESNASFCRLEYMFQ